MDQYKGEKILKVQRLIKEPSGGLGANLNCGDLLN